VNLEEFTQNSINSPGTPAAVVKTFHDVKDFIQDSILDCNVPQGLTVNAIKRFAEVYKVNQNWFLPCQALFDNLSQPESLFTAPLGHLLNFEHNHDNPNI